MRKIIFFISVSLITYVINGQCTFQNTDQTTMGVSTSKAGQSFKPTCNGILNTIGVVALNNKIVTVTIRSGEGYIGSVLLGTLTNQFTTPTGVPISFSVFDFSSLNITLTAGQSYTFDVLGTGLQLLFDNDSDIDYPDGQRYDNEAAQATSDLLFDIDLTAIPCTDPDVPTVTFTPPICEGSSGSLTISGDLNDATAWHVYTGSCGGTAIGTTTSSTISITPGSPSTTYFVRGEGACVSPASCGTVTVTTTPLDNASFSYSAAAYCIDESNQTPTISGLSGGTFSSAVGLNINPATGIINPSASTPNTYTITYTTSGTCSNSDTASVTINALDDATFNYSSTSYCINGSDPIPTITGLSGGIFSSTAGLIISTSTGAIDLNASTPNTYTITYTTTGTCPNTETTTVTINTLDDATFNYSTASYCADESDPTPTITGLSGGIFSSTAGLIISASTGAINLNASTPNTYTITYTTTGTCPNTETTTVTINTLDDATFNYSTASYCADESDPTPTITGLSGGMFSSTAGLIISASTGIIDLDASTPNTYKITYTTTGTCPNNNTTSITVNAVDDASFNYDAASYCINGTDPIPTITGLSGGIFSSTAGLIISASTGAIDLNTSTANTYTIKYTTTGTCPNTETTTVTINTLDDATFNYSTASYCANESDPTPTITGLSGGIFSSTAGLIISASTGIIDLDASTPNTYTITYITTGVCTNNETTSVTINAVDDASFNYEAASYCINGTDPIPTITGLSGGIFSSTAGININASTGVIDLSNSMPNTYSVTYTTTGVCTNNETTSVTINPVDDESFNYSTSSYCANGNDPTPSITGLSGGIFTSSPGLIINASTGVIDLDASTPNTYTVTYTTSGDCSKNQSATITITPLDHASFSYSAGAYCIYDNDPIPTITGLLGGTFSSSLGLVIDASSGIIDLDASTSDTYIITYTTIGTCSNSASLAILINQIDASIDDSATPTFNVNTAAGSYQWINCDMNQAIIGETNQSFTAILNGNYAVDITTNGCTVRSSCYSVNTLSTEEQTTYNESLQIYPNPTTGIVNLNKNAKEILIYNLNGQTVMKASSNKFDMSQLPNGIYFIAITTEEASGIRRIIKQ